MDMLWYIPPLLLVCCHMVSSHLCFTLYAYQCIVIFNCIRLFGLGTLHFAYAITCYSIVCASY
jgi:hypothetical protein